MYKKFSKKEFSSLGFLFDEERQRVLLHLRDDKTIYNPNQWAFFGGDKEGEETPVQCFIRELKEELGVDVREEEVFSLRNYFNEEFQIQRYVFFVKKYVPESKIKLTEGKACKWIPLTSVFDYDLTDKTRDDLKTFLEKYNLQV